MRWRDFHDIWKQHVKSCISECNINLIQVRVDIINRRNYINLFPDQDRHIAILEALLNKEKDLNKKLLFYRSQIGTEVVSRYIFTKFIELLVDEMIKKGYTLKVPRLGNLGVVNKKLKKKVINWGESNKLRALLESKGIPIYNKETNPTGRKWLIYYTADSIPLFYWRNSLCRFENGNYYSFIPTGGEKGNARALQRYANLNNKSIYRQWNVR